jgi:hypothetical protein
MNWLIIRLGGGGWMVEVANTNIHYFFAGNFIQQAQNVQAFAQSLADGDAGVLQFFDPNSVAPGVIEQQLFGDTDTVVFEGIMGPASESNLFDILEDVGEFILDCL